MATSRFEHEQADTSEVFLTVFLTVFEWIDRIERIERFLIEEIKIL